MKIMTLALATLFTLLGPVSLSFARTVDSCLSLEGMGDVSILKQELERASINYRTEPNVICVTEDQREKFLRIISRVYPANPSESQKIKVPQSPSGIPLNSTQLADPTQHRMLQEELKRHKIWYTTDETGVLWYEATNEKQVSGLVFNINESDIPVDRSVHLAQPFSRALFKAELTRHGVPFEAKTRRNEEWIVWNEADTPRVKKIQEFVDNETIEHFKKQLESRKRNQSN